MEPTGTQKGSGQKELTVKGGGRRDQAKKGAWGYCEGKDLPPNGFQQDVVFTYKMGSNHLLEEMIFQRSLIFPVP